MNHTLEVRTRVANLLLQELQQGKRRWFFISVATRTEFLGGYYIHAFGPTDAFCLLHALNFYPLGSDASTRTTEVPEQVVIPEKDRWRRLSREELNPQPPHSLTS